MKFVHICLAHIGKLSALNDRGVVWDDGVSTIYESVESLMFAALLVETIYNSGHDDIVPFVYGDGDYSVRSQRANMIDSRFKPKISVYLSPHLNAGGGDYSLILYDGRSQKSEDLADMVKRRWEEIEGMPPVKTLPVNPGDRGYVIVRFTKMPALILEPLFLDNPEHREQLFELYPRIVQSTFEGLLDFFKAYGER